MRLPSLTHLRAAAAHAFRRFPAVLIVTVAATIAGIVVAQGEEDAARHLLVALLGIPLFLAANLATAPGARRTILRILAMLVLGLLFWRWPDWSDQIRALRYLQLSLAAHLLVAFLPYIRRDEPNGFWQYNRAILIRFLTAVLYSAVFFAGLVIALVAFDNLFGVDVEPEAYFTLFMLLGILFNTWFFLSGVPEDLSALERETGYPVGLKIFAQHVLVPLVTVYLIMLTAYLGKVLITTSWPDGWIGLLVSSVAAVGILSLLLVHPVRDEPGNRWIATYSRGFWIAMLPAIVMLLLAIWKRIEQYGVTEPRYILVILALWLAAMAVLFIVNRRQHLIVIPATLCALALVTLVGPWSAYGVSLRDQTGRLADLLRANGMLVEGRVRAPADSVPFNDRKEIGAVFKYLGETHGLRSVIDWYGGEFPAADSVDVAPVHGWQARDQARRILRGLGLEHVDENAQPGGAQFFTYSIGYLPPPQPVLDVAGYDSMFEWTAGSAPGRFLVGTDTLVVDPISDDGRLRVRLASGPAVVLDLAGLVAELRAVGLPPGYTTTAPDQLRASARTGGLRVLVLGRSLSGGVTGGGVNVSSFDARFFVSTGADIDEAD